MTGTPGGPGGWLEEAPSRMTPLVDLLCFPGAGAGASAFRPWLDGLPPYAVLLACRLPGREGRIDEPPAESLSAAARAVAEAYAARRPRPLVLFGHSMGAVLAFETARLLGHSGRAPAAVALSASEPPRGHGGEGMDREALEALLLAYDPENAAVVNDAELSAWLLPILEADITLLRRHRIEPEGVTLDVPAWLFSGSRDRLVPHGAVAGWAGHFSGKVTLEEFPGGHQFPFRESREAVLMRLGSMLREAAGRGRK